MKMLTLEQHARIHTISFLGERILVTPAKKGPELVVSEPQSVSIPRMTDDPPELDWKIFVEVGR